MTDEARFAGSEGEIFYRRWLPDGVVRRIVVVVHGYAEHGGRYGHAADMLRGGGAAVYAEDHIGHGRSDGERALITDFEHVVDDLEALVRIAADEHPGVPVVMIGHSMGGLLTARSAQRFGERLAGIGFLGAVIGDWAWARNVLAAEELPAASSDPSGMSRDQVSARGYADDPLVYHGGYKRPLLEAEVVALDRFNEEIDRLTMPVLCLHGSDDPFVPPGDTLVAVARMPAADKEIRVYPGARHELVNEINRSEVLGDLAGFLERVAP